MEINYLFEFSDMKVWVLRIVAVLTLIIICLFCHNKIWGPIKSQLLGDLKLQPTDETSMDWKTGKSDNSKNLPRDSKRAKLAPLFSKRISMLKEVQHIISAK